MFPAPPPGVLPEHQALPPYGMWGEPAAWMLPGAYSHALPPLAIPVPPHPHVPYAFPFPPRTDAFEYARPPPRSTELYDPHAPTPRKPPADPSHASLRRASADFSSLYSPASHLPAAMAAPIPKNAIPLRLRNSQASHPPSQPSSSVSRPLALSSCRRVPLDLLTYPLGHGDRPEVGRCGSGERGLGEAAGTPAHPGVGRPVPARPRRPRPRPGRPARCRRHRQVAGESLFSLSLSLSLCAVSTALQEDGKAIAIFKNAAAARTAQEKIKHPAFELRPWTITVITSECPP
jgi:hypothetical protein